MPIMPGMYELGPENASLRIETKRGGAAAKAGHDLVLEVGSWRGTLEIGEDPGQNRLVLSADSGSVEVIEGTGGITALTDEDKVEIKRTLEDEVLQPAQVEFESTQVTPADEGKRVQVKGELSMNGTVHPLEFGLEAGTDGAVSARATVNQSDWGIKPYSGLFGTLKVKDEIEVIAEGSLSSGR